jgi:TldD protein
MTRAHGRSQGAILLGAVGLVLCGLLFPRASSAALPAPPNDQVFAAMRDELDRSMKDLIIAGLSAPYFLSYRVRDDVYLNLEARYTAMVDSSVYRSRQLGIDLRVGDPALDNSNFYEEWQDIWDDGLTLVNEDSYAALRHELWFMTDAAYKRALETLAQKKAYLQAHPPKKVLADFTEEKPLVSLGETTGLPAQVATAGSCVRASSEACRRFPSLQDWRVTCSIRSSNQRYLNSDGSEHRKGSPRVYYDMSASLQANDGQRLTGFATVLRRADDPLPPPSQLAEEARALARDLEAMAQASPLEEYVGPVLFTDWASAQLVSQLFASQLSLPREALTTESWMKDQVPLGKLAARIKRRVLPSFVTVTDQPRLETWEGTRLMGTSAVDDEGVECQDITLVENGRLVGIPLSRQPVEGFSRSNGHARALGRKRPSPTITNLVVTSTQVKPYEKLVEQLRRLCDEQGLEYGLLVRKLEENRFSDLYRQVEKQDNEPILLTAPLIVYKVYAKDGRSEPVRGLGFDEVTVRSLRDIVAMGKDTRAYNLQQPFLGGSGTSYPASIITPSILVEEMELKSVAVQEPSLVEKNPIFH